MHRCAQLAQIKLLSPNSSEQARPSNVFNTERQKITLYQISLNELFRLLLHSENTKYTWLELFRRIMFNPFLNN